METPNIVRQRFTEDYEPEIVECSLLLRTNASSPSDPLLLTSHLDEENL
jgi:hypothetical protein